MVATVASPAQSPTQAPANSDSRRKGQKNNFIDQALDGAEKLSLLPLDKLAEFQQKLEKSKNPFSRWLSDVCKGVGITPDQGLTDLVSLMELQNNLNPLVLFVMDDHAKTHPKKYKGWDDWSKKDPEEFQACYNQYLKWAINDKLGSHSESATFYERLVSSNEYASSLVDKALNNLKLSKKVQETNSEGKTETKEAVNNIKLFFRKGKVAEEIRKLIEKEPTLRNNPEARRTIENLAKTQINQRFEGMAQIFNFGVFPTMIGPLFINGARMASEMGNSFLSQIAMALALTAFSTQSIAIGKSVTNLNYSGLGARTQKLIAPLLFLTFFSHIFASLTRIAGVFFDVPPEEEAKPNAFTAAKKFLSSFFFKPIEVLARMVNSSSFALFTLKDLAEWKTLENSSMDRNSLAYKTELNVIKAKTAFNGIATLGTTISNIGGLIAEHKQESIYKDLEPLIKLLNGENVSAAEIMNNPKLPPQAKELALKFIKERDILMSQIEAYGNKLVAQVKAGKLSPEKAQALLEQKQQALGSKLEGILQQIVAIIQDKTKGVSQQAWLFESIGTLSFLGILPSLLCRRSIQGLTEAARLIQTEPKRFAGKNNVVKFCRAYGEVVNSGKLTGMEEGGKNNIAKFRGRMDKFRTWTEIPFMLLIAGISVVKMFTAENSPLYNDELKAFLDKHKTIVGGLEAVSNFAMLV